MNADLDTLRQINGLPEPRHLFSVPVWIDPAALDRLIEHGCITVSHLQREKSGTIQVAMGLQLTTKGKRLIHPEFAWRNLAVKGSLAGASLTAMSLLILYLG